MADSAIPNKIGDYEIQEILGKGAFATTCKAIHVHTNLPVAIKVVEKSSLSEPNNQKRFDLEIFLLRNLHHPFIAKYFQLLEDSNFCFICMEYIENEDLYHHVNELSDKRLEEKEARYYFEQLILVLEYLHNEKKVVHRDIKGQNLVLDRGFNIKVIDFGIANVLSNSKAKLSSLCGSLCFMAPEILAHEPYIQSVDIWSAGVLLYSLIIGTLPFYRWQREALIERILNVEPVFPKDFHPLLQDFLSKLLCKDPATRISIEQIKEHPWFSKDEYEYIKQNSMHLMQSEFILGRRNVIDQEIVEKMNRMNINTDYLKQSLKSRETNTCTISYHILAREKLVEGMKELKTKVMAQNFKQNFQKIEVAQNVQNVKNCQQVRKIQDLKVYKLNKGRPIIILPQTNSRRYSNPAVIVCPTKKNTSKNNS